MQYVLDTSAILAFIENEEGVGEVEKLLQKALDDEIVLTISIVSCIEVSYISWQEQGDQAAVERLQLINDLTITQEPVDSQLIRIIGEIKAVKNDVICRLLYCRTREVQTSNACP